MIRVWCVLFLLIAKSVQAQSSPDTTAIIGQITINNRNIFDLNNPRYSRFPYPLINRLHMKTRSHVIRRELLFESGDHLNLDLLEESARNLRKFSFIGAASIKVQPRARADTVNVVVTTDDQWTTEPDLVIDHRGNLSRLGIGIEEEDLFGMGKYFNLRFVTSTDRTLWRTIYRDPRLLGSRWTSEVTGIHSNEGTLVDFDISRPLFSLSTRWAFNSRYTYENGIDRLYDSGRLSVSVRTHRQWGHMSFTRVWGDPDLRHHLVLGLSVEDQTFPGKAMVEHPDSASAQLLSTQGIMEHHDIRFAVTWKRERLDFVKRRFIDFAGLIEDIRVGSTFSLSAGGAHGYQSNRDGYGIFSGSFVESMAPGENHLAIFSVASGAHFDEHGLDNGSLFSFLHYYYQGFPMQTIAFGASYLHVWRMDQPYQLVLGDDVGLRGFPARQFTGDRLFLLNIEDRVFTPVEIATLQLGFAAFWDMGMTWNTRQDARWQDLAASAGIGLRLGVGKGADAPVFRLDLAFPVHRKPFGNRYTISFSFSPIFRSFRAPEATLSRF